MVQPNKVRTNVRGAKPKEDVTVRLLSAFKRLIFEGAIAPGSRLPAERDLAERFDVSRSSLRQALKVLEIMGVISQRVGDGTYLNAAAPSLLGEPLEFLILLDGISFHELMEARIVVEPELAARAAERATVEDLAALRTEMEAMKANFSNHARLSQHDLEFHQAIFHAAGNRVCSMMFTVIHRSLQNLIELTSTLVPPEHTYRLHQRIYSAIQRRDPEEARKRMSEHLLDAKSLFDRASKHQSELLLEDRISELAARSVVPIRPAPRKRKP